MKPYREIVRELFEELNNDIVRSIKSNPETAVIRASGKFEKFIDSAQSVEIKGFRFVKYSVPYTPYIDAGRTNGKPPPFSSIYEWLGLRKYGIKYADDKERRSIAWAIMFKQAEKGSFRFRNESKRTNIIEKAISDSIPPFIERLASRSKTAFESPILEEIRRINKL